MISPMPVFWAGGRPDSPTWATRPSWARQYFGKLVAEETEKWGKVIRAAHIKAE
jgi:hypothetical protein